jgi:hypothetical protein
LDEHILCALLDGQVLGAELLKASNEKLFPSVACTKVKDLNLFASNLINEPKSSIP